MIKKLIIFSTIATVCYSSEGWTKQNFNYENFNLPYQIFEPIQNQKDEKIPLVIYLHGSGEAGTDNEKQMYAGTNIGPQYFSSEDNQKIQRSYVLAPQTPAEIRWASNSIAEYDFRKTPTTESMKALLNLIDKLEKELNIDSNSIYIAGLSRGGQGVWNAAMNAPEKFAAIVPIAGSGSPKDVNLIKNIPTWVFHGEKDEITPLSVSENMVNALKSEGKNVKFTIVKNGNHESSWLEAHKNSELWKWMISNKKR
ncbi:MAG: prolyl oligopeptidase family serine peptidase [Cetobacterium sp.]